jgi:hypothetical protein
VARRLSVRRSHARLLKKNVPAAIAKAHTANDAIDIGRAAGRFAIMSARGVRSIRGRHRSGNERCARRSAQQQ